MKKLDNTQLTFLIKLDEWLSDNFEPNGVVFILPNEDNPDSHKNYTAQSARLMLLNIMVDRTYPHQQSVVLNFLRGAYLTYNRT